MDETLQDLRERIADEGPYVDVKPYSHNIIGLLLSQIAEKYGKAEANKAIRELYLDRMGWKEVE